MPLGTECRVCYGSGEVNKWDREKRATYKAVCDDCGGTGQVDSYRTALTQDQANALGYTPINCWPRYGGDGNCKVCSKALTGRKTQFCGRECRWAFHCRLYKNVHWQKRHIAVRDGTVCKLCGEVFDSAIVEGGPLYPHPQKMELDHIVPLCRGGTEHPDNLQLLCPECHRAKTKTDLSARRFDKKSRHQPELSSSRGNLMR